jgi:hypothetical protein
LNVLQYFPAANTTGTASNLATTASNEDNIDQFLGRVDQNVGNKIRLYGRYNWHDSRNTSIGATPALGVTQPRVNKNTLVTYSHTLKPTLFNDFRIGYHRLDFDTLNPFAVNDQQGAGTALGIPGFDGDTKYNNPGGFRASPSASSAACLRVERTGISSTPPSRRRTCSPGTAARTTCARASTCVGWRPAGERPTMRADCSTSPVTCRDTGWRIS